MEDPRDVKARQAKNTAMAEAKAAAAVEHAKVVRRPRKPKAAAPVAPVRRALPLDKLRDALNSSTAIALARLYA